MRRRYACAPRHRRMMASDFGRTRILCAVLIWLVASLPVAGSASQAPVTAEPASYVLRFAASSSPAEQAAVLSAAGALQGGEIEVLRLMQVNLHGAGLQILRQSPVVEWIYREGTSQIAGGRPNDPLLSKQWALRKIGAFRGWQAEKGKSNPVVVAVVDTGVDPSHPDLQGRLVEGFDFVNKDDDPADDHGHGTHVAGVIAARPNNRKGISGLSWGSKVMPFKACDASGACADFPIAASIVRAVESGARVVNLSLGGAGAECSRGFELAMQFARTRDVVLVAAAGNSGDEEAGNPATYPAGCEGYVAVGATDPSDAWAPFSGHHDYVDLSAPGVQVQSTITPDLAMPSDGSAHGYGASDGTSMAAPHVAGLAALLFSQNPTWTSEEVQERMEATAVDLGKKGQDPYFGAGRIDVARALGARP